MPCYRPIKAYKAPGGAGGKARIVFNPDEAYAECQLPCGQCIGCRLERSRQWAMRCMHEASLYENNCFITLTYDSDFLPKDGSLNKKHFQDFMKRLRSRFPEAPIRFYHCGEYGEKFRRPHYHACLFNFDFEDKKFYAAPKGDRLYTSDILDRVWGMGFSLVGNVTFESAAYVARYVMKKVTGKRAESHYEVLDEKTGEIRRLAPEYTTMSRRPGVGREWYERYSGDIFPDDFVIVRGRKMKPPRFYDLLLEVDDPEEYKRLKAERAEAAKLRGFDNTPERLKVRETVKRAQVGMLKRGLENEA